MNLEEHTIEHASCVRVWLVISAIWPFCSLCSVHEGLLFKLPDLLFRFAKTAACSENFRS